MTAADIRINRLSRVSVAQVIEPEEAFDFAALGTGRLLPDELLSIAGLDLKLTDKQRARLSREETASMLAAGIRFPGRARPALRLPAVRIWRQLLLARKAVTANHRGLATSLAVADE